MSERRSGSGRQLMWTTLRWMYEVGATLVTAMTTGDMSTLPQLCGQSLAMLSCACQSVHGMRTTRNEASELQLLELCYAFKLSLSGVSGVVVRGTLARAILPTAYCITFSLFAEALSCIRTCWMRLMRCTAAPYAAASITHGMQQCTLLQQRTLLDHLALLRQPP